jgi:hypothetical protein
MKPEWLINKTALLLKQRSLHPDPNKPAIDENLWMQRSARLQLGNAKSFRRIQFSRVFKEASGK